MISLPPRTPTVGDAIQAQLFNGKAAELREQQVRERWIDGFFCGGFLWLPLGVLGGWLAALVLRGAP